MPAQPLSLDFSQQLLITAVTTVLSSGFTLFTIWYKNKLDRKKSPDLSDPDFEDMLQPILDSIQDHTQALRVKYYEGKNGTNTLSGYHIKTLNCMLESNAQGIRPLKDELQNIPVDSVKRNVANLRNASSYIISDEGMQNDEIAQLSISYGVRKIILFKVLTGFNKWTGILSVGFADSDREITAADLAWLHFQASRIGNILKKQKS